ncbi:MAG: glycosyltransferase family 4 protein, partial [Minisyncoccia bacterium]
MNLNHNKKYSTIGGGNKHLYYIFNELKNKKDVEINNFFIEIENFNIKNIILSFIKFLNEIKNFIPKSDIILVNSPYPNDFFAGLILYFKTKIPVAIYFHHYLSPFYKPIKRGFFRSFIYGIVLSFEIALAKIFEIPIFIDNHKFYKLGAINLYEDEDAPDKINLDKYRNNKEKIYDLCYIGRLQKHKGIIDLLKVIKKLKKKGYNLKIALIGEIGKEKKKLIRIIKKYKIKDNIIFFGKLQEDEKNKILAKSKIFISLSYEEGWGLSVMDAAYLGIPIVAYSLRAYSYLNDNYFKCKVGDLNDVVEKIIYIMENYEEATKLSLEAEKIVSNYDYKKISNDQYKYYL